MKKSNILVAARDTASCKVNLYIKVDSWKEIESMHTNRAFASCFLFLGKIYVFGGRANSLKLSKKI